MRRDNSVALEIRDASIRPRSFNADDNTIEVIAASATPVARRDARGEFLEILDAAGADLDALRGASVLDGHQQGGVASILGTVEDAWREGDTIAARLRLSTRPEVAAIVEDIRQGIIASVSVGYVVDEWKDSTVKGKRARTATRWTPREISFVAIGADPVARSRNIEGTLDISDRATINPQIRQLADQLGISRGLTDSLIDRGATIEMARSEMLDHIRTQRDDPQVFVRNVADALYHTRIDPSVPLAPAARAYAGMTCADIARELLNRAGVSVTGMSPPALISRAIDAPMTTSDFASIMATVYDKTMRQAYGAVPSGLIRVARETTAQDFRAKSRVQLDHSGLTLDKVSEAGEFKFGGLIDSQESYSIDSYGKILNLSRKLLINDNIGALADVARRIGMAAREFERQQLVTLLISNSGAGPVMSDGVALFNAAHKNVGTAGVPSETTLSEARLLMRDQTGPGGGLISVVPRYLVCPSELETSCEKLITSIQATQTSNVNVFAFLDLVIEPRLTDPKRYYVVADPAQVDGLEFAFLAGQSGPQTESRSGFEVDGIQVKVRDDYGAGFVEWRSWCTNAGA
ncbi:hypothetical protein XH94_09500 [Bradyrhizobium zhanjiangense]|uniref:Peptidase U35 n=2 Tax=Bradyrhizobium zhanjiangense TaxID=1325107 RepID=A0A4Q0SQY5_9BRAD|nr:hypothetical protein XH94_09500 [Bradyrhizobium zhanjiangense]